MMILENSEKLSGNHEILVGYPKEYQDTRSPCDASLLWLTLPEIHGYKFNPRKHENHMYDELKSSIRKRGLDSILQVTKRPHEDIYIVEAGGNTRLEILNDLWKETGDEKFFKIQVMYRPWVNELHVFTSHLSENILRSDMCFYDRSKAILKIKELIEVEDSTSMNWSEFERKLKDIGLQHSHAQIARMRFLLETLSPFVPDDVLMQIGPHYVQRLQSAFKDASKRAKHPFPSAYKDELEESFKKHQCDIASIIQDIGGLIASKDSDNDIMCQDEKKVDGKYQIKEVDENNLADIQSMGGDVEPGEPIIKKEYIGQSIHHLQQIIELRARLYQQVKDILGDDVWMTDNAFGFGVNITDNSNPIHLTLEQMSAYGLGSTERMIDISQIYSISPDEFPCFLNILSLSQKIIEVTRILRAKKVVEDELDDLSNDIIINTQIKLDPSIKEENEQIKKFIEHEATNTMLHSLFPTLNSTDIAQLRDKLNVENSGGRPPKALPFEVEKIKRLYQHHHQHIDLKKLYLKIAEETELPLSTIWNTLKSLEFHNN